MTIILLLNNDQCYNLLGIRKGASIPEIRDAYRRLALECHPDKNMSARDGAKFKLVTEAYHTLRVGNLHADKNSSTYKNQSNTYHKVQSWSFYQNMFYDALDHAQKIKHAKTIYLYLSKSEPIIIRYCKLTRKHAAMPLYHLLVSSYTRTNSLVSHVHYKGLIRGACKYLGLNF